MKVQQPRRTEAKPLREKKEKKPRLQALRRAVLDDGATPSARTRLWQRLRRLIERADLPLKPVELFYMMAGVEHRSSACC